MIEVRSVEILNNPALFTDPYRLKITLECIAPLKDDVEWKLVFVPSPESTAHDQELDECLIGPLVIGANTFEFYAEAPDWSKIPTADLFGVSVLYLTGNYNGREFVRVNYYQNTEYDTDELRESPPQKVLWNRLTRDVLAKPKVLRYSIQWDAIPIANTTVAGPNVAAAAAAPPSADAL